MNKNTLHFLAKTATVIVGTLFVVTSFSFAATAPQIQTNSASNLVNNSAMLNAYVLNMGGDSTVTVWFQWGQTNSYGNETNHATQNSASSLSQTIYGLNANTTYHFRAVIQNSFGTTYGSNVSFVANNSGSGGVTANAGSNQTVSAGQSVILQGSGYDSNNSNLTYSWACTGGTLSNYNVAQPTYTAPSYNGNISSYICSLTVTNNLNQSNTSTMTVYINGSGNGNNAISVQTNSATNIYGASATLNGYFYANNGAVTNTYAWFQWGTTTGYGYETTHQYATNSGVLVQTITNLSDNTIYHFRAVAQSNNGTIVYGQDMTFTNYNTTGYNNYNNVGYTGNYGNNLTITSTDPNFYPSNTNDPTVLVNKNQVQGATDIATGLTNDLFFDSFFLPLLVIIAGFMFWRYVNIFLLTK